ncbi:MAG: hypothetical protein ACI9SY_000178 [Candidatus Paceibacteria bacterium]|jgi:hypothetical protein
MFPQASSGLKKSIIVVVMVAMLTFSAPKESDAILLLLLAPVTTAAVVAVIVTELVIYCAVGLICGGGGGGGGGTPPPPPPPPPPPVPCSPENYCGESSSGIITAGGFCSVTAPSNSTCTNFAFPDDPLTISPGLVRVSDQVTIQYDVGPNNFPPNCTLRGPQIGPAGSGTLVLTTQTGTEIVTALAPYFYRLECGTESFDAGIEVVGSVQEI